jgi:parallel beta-helix repeat protein
VAAASPKATIRIAPGTYPESVLVKGAKNGLTIEGADPADPPEILGVAGSKLDGIRVEYIDGLTVRHLRIVDAYDAVRLNYATNALLEDLQLENSALGVRMNGGASHTLRDSTIAVTRTEQGVWIEYSPDTVLERLTITNGSYGGIRIRNSERVRLSDVTVRDSEGSDGIKLEYAPDARVERCAAHDGYSHGFRVLNSPGLVFTDNAAKGNQGTGIRLENSSPFATVADVLAAGNSASGNVQDVVVVP